MFSDLLDLSTSSNDSGQDGVVFGFDTFALQLQDIDPNSFNGQTFSVNLGSVEDALQSEGGLGDSLVTSETVMDILVKSTASVYLPESFLENVDNLLANDTDMLRLSYSVFLTDVLFQSPNQSGFDIGSIIVSSRLSYSTLLKPVQVSFRTARMVYSNVALAIVIVILCILMQKNDSELEPQLDNGACAIWKGDEGMEYFYMGMHTCIIILGH